MRKCLELAGKGFGMVSPNPMVGCIIVKDGEIIGQSYHKIFGGPHAEVNAMEDVKEKQNIEGSTVYVSLEPCSHHGKTPPCADLLIEKRVKEVVVGIKDPNPIVEGKGIEKLIQAGISVKSGILESECRKLNKRFFTFQIKKRPYVILKWAESADGFMGTDVKLQISGLAAQTRLHKWRSEEDAFLVGTNTLLQDNPQLNARLWKGKNPTRVAVDMQLRSDLKPLKFYDQSQKTIILNGLRKEEQPQTNWLKIKNNSPSEILHALYEQNIGSLVVEGGFAILQSFLNSGLYDEIRRFRSKEKRIHSGIPSPKIDFSPTFSEDLIDDDLDVFLP